MLVPIELGKLDHSPSSFRDCPAITDELDRFMNSAQLEHLASHAWIWSARRCPILARGIVVVGRRFATSGACSHAVRAFAQHPHWLGLAEFLAKSADEPEPVGDEVLLAQLAQFAARLTKWAPAEEAYWHALTQTQPVGRYADADDLRPVEPAERCRVLARWCLDAQSMSHSSQRTEMLSPRESARALDSLAEHFDIDQLFQELDSLRQVSASTLDRVAARRLAALARLAGYRQEARWHDTLFQMVAGQQREEAIKQAASLVRQWLVGNTALWMASGPASDGSAVWADEQHAGKMVTAQGMREEVESKALPLRFRCSSDLVSIEGRLVGRVYSDTSVHSPLADRWLGRLASAWGTFLSRTPSAPPVPSLVDKQEVAAFDQQRIIVRRAIGEFSAGAGHEINNPLGAISGHALRLLKEEVVPERRHSLQQIQQQVLRIRRMIKDLQLIGGALSLDRSPIDLSSLLAEAGADAEKRLAGGHLILQNCPSDWKVVGDRAMLARMLSEIMVNGAEAAGPTGEVRVSVERSPADPEAFELVVRDNGPGLSRQDRLKAFIPFYSGREAGRGLGMGLPVAERIATEHGGSITIAHGKPTTVRIQLPAGMRKAG